MPAKRFRLLYLAISYQLIAMSYPTKNPPVRAGLFASILSRRNQKSRTQVGLGFFDFFETNKLDTITSFVTTDLILAC